MQQISMLLGGFALFLFGMHEMGKGLELLAGNKLQDILEKLTSNKYVGVLIGAIVTAIIQSSSATTVMTVGFVNSKILSLTQAIHIIMGANIGTTVTGLLLTLDIKLVAPVITFVGMAMMLFVKKRKYKYAGTILFGFGTLFMGMNIMGEAVKPLAKNVAFTSLLARSSNPVIGILEACIIYSNYTKFISYNRYFNHIRINWDNRIFIGILFSFRDKYRYMYHINTFKFRHKQKC